MNAWLSGTSWRVLLLGVVALTASWGTVGAAVYEVGPGHSLKEPGEVPWESLMPGDLVQIHWRAEPYRSKWVICRRGTEEAPIVVRGVAGPEGQLPVIDGRDAITRPQLNYWHEERSIIKIGGANEPPDLFPGHIVIENLEIRSGREPYFFTGRKGRTAYKDLAAAIFISKGEHIAIRNCVLHDCGNGFMTSAQTRDVLLEGCHVYGNGVEGSVYMHNIYTSSQGMTFQYNRLDPLRPGCPGNNLKDRSSGLVVRYNRIQGGNRQLDLVDAEDSEELRNDPAYWRTLVYGNLLIENQVEDNNQIVHYGGDSGRKQWYRPGTLYFYNNTVISYRASTTTLVRMSSDAQRVHAFNNILYATAGGRYLALTAGRGELIVENNWLPEGVAWVAGRRGEDLSTNLLGTDPGFRDLGRGDFRLREDSPACGKGRELPEALLPDFAVSRQYVLESLHLPRGRTGLPGVAAPDLGALECHSYGGR